LGGRVSEGFLWDTEEIPAGNTGLTAPDGRFYPFKDGELLVLEKIGQGPDRKPYIVLKDGIKVPAEVWIEKYNKEQEKEREE